eukprot:1562678-Prymnesium_polylepis.1
MSASACLQVHACCARGTWHVARGAWGAVLQSGERRPAPHENVAKDPQRPARRRHVERHKCDGALLRAVRRVEDVVGRLERQRRVSDAEAECRQRRQVAVRAEQRAQPRREPPDTRRGSERAFGGDRRVGAWRSLGAPARAIQREQAEGKRREGGGAHLAPELDVGDEHLPVARRVERHPQQWAHVERRVDATKEDGRRLAALGAEGEGEDVAVEQPLLHNGIEERRGALDRQLREAQPEDAVEGILLERETLLVAHLDERLVGHLQLVEAHRVLRHHAIDRAGAEPDERRLVRHEVCRRAPLLETDVAPAAARLAQAARHPQVGGARVEDDGESLQQDGAGVSGHAAREPSGRGATPVEWCGHARACSG